MGDVVRAFDAERRGGGSGRGDGHAERDLPWAVLRDNELPPMMFQLRKRDGSLVSFSYTDIREIRSQHSGQILIFVYAFRKTMIRLEGRHLRELVALLGRGLVRWIEEADEYDARRQENEPDVLEIVIEEVAQG